LGHCHSVGDVTAHLRAVDAHGGELSRGGIQAVFAGVADDDGAMPSDQLRSGKPHASSPTSDDGYLTH